MTVEQMERRLQALAVDVDWPDLPDLAPQVRERIAAAPRRKPMSQWWPRLRPALAVAGFLLVVFATLLVVSPGTRSAVASWFGLGGVQVDRDADSSDARSSEPTRLTVRDLPEHMGDPVILAQAAAAVDFPLRTVDLRADLDRVGGGVYVDDTVEGGMVHIVYPPQEGLPAASQAKGIGAIFTQFQGQDSPTFTKELADGNNAEFVEFEGDVALWVTGPSHVLIRNASGEPLRHTARLSANSLIWVGDGGVTYRLESDLTLTEALQLAATLN